ncbi:MAG: Crp/Fnr family transcriptional regulator [Clostridium sp.]|uniref:Crp/Fnr family transcriptional regulator n=1 Tax=Clostridium sp. TaxID=1506 RepID=UPI00290BF9D0|nr:Crp/Fnr family transcriptional regulator [Clostridium sp.]MDU5109101.1 Crp/Fnr family transcriptional regulator [Clostridium sp.]
MKKEDKYKLIKNTFSNNNYYPSNEIIEKILEISSEAHFLKNDMILNMWDDQNEVYIIFSGIARSYYLDKEGNDITKFFMKENDFCIGESLFSNQKSIQGFEALENITALKFKAKELKELILQNESLTRLYMEFLENNLLYKMQREYAFQIMSATERYIAFQKEYKDIKERVSQHYIASYLGITPESLSRIRRTIKEEN